MQELRKLKWVGERFNDSLMLKKICGIGFCTSKEKFAPQRTNVAPFTSNNVPQRSNVSPRRTNVAPFRRNDSPRRSNIAPFLSNDAPWKTNVES